MEMPYSCDKCEKLFDIKPYLKAEDEDKPIGEVLKERFGEKVLCEDCKISTGE